jgi:hypothetical protein
VVLINDRHETIAEKIEGKICVRQVNYKSNGGRDLGYLKKNTQRENLWFDPV